MKEINFKGLLLLLAITTGVSRLDAQSLTGSNRRTILTAVPFLSIAPDSRSTGMGDVGVATSPDINSAHWNNGKLAFIENDFGGSISYSPWLRNIVPDMALVYVSGFYKIDDVQTAGLSMRYFDLGDIFLTDQTGGSIGTDSPYEMAIDGTYSRKLSENWGIGVTGRFILSDLRGPSGGQDRAATSVAVDLGTYYRKEVVIGRTNSELSFGAHISNIGQKIDYGVSQANQGINPDGTADFIPVNLRLGTALKLELDPYNSLTLAVDINKLLVPTPPIFAEDENGDPVFDNSGNRVIAEGEDPDRNLIAGIFGSFSDAPGGFSEELQEITVSAGAEYWYRDVFSVRAGYFYESFEKGGRRYFSMGAGLRYQTFGLDFSYLVPGDQNNPLADALRFTLLFQMKKAEQG